MEATSHQEQKKEAKEELTELITNCEELYTEYDVIRIQVRFSRATLQFNQFTESINSTGPRDEE